MLKSKVAYFVIFSLIVPVYSISQTKIDRQALVERHNVINNGIDSLSSLSVGNGRFAFTVDATGLQTFPHHYAKGIPLGTQSEWGWHSFTDTANYSFEETLKTYLLDGRKVTFPVQSNGTQRSRNAANWFRENSHRLQLGNLGLVLLHKDGSEARITDITGIRQILDLWKGTITSAFSFDGEAVKVITYCHQDQDLIAVNIDSKLVRAGRLKLRLIFPFPTNQFTDDGVNYKNPHQHFSSIISSAKQQALITHHLDTSKYDVHLKWQGTATVSNDRNHQFTLVPNGNSDQLVFTCAFVPHDRKSVSQTFVQTAANNTKRWKAFWLSGAAVDFSGSTDKRASELERRVVLSQYLTKIQCSGATPPQETGLTYNSWYGKPHLEMHWWHATHFALWGREQLMENSMMWYDQVKGKAFDIAKRQGYGGVRWQKMTDVEGNESPSFIAPFLIWQQPHFIYFAELAYRAHPDKRTMEKYKNLVFATADFMASYPTYDKVNDRYNLGNGLIPVQETYDPEKTFNPPYELQYWRWALSVAQIWRERLQMSPNPQYGLILDKLAKLPQKDGVYVSTEGTPDCYSTPNLLKDHPSVLMAYGVLPYDHMMDSLVMKKTFHLIWDKWHWNDTWGWDFPMVAMTAARLNMPSKAIDALFMPVQKNTYLNNGHNYQDKSLRLYLPGNGGLLAAVAMMCAGWDGSKLKEPGFPKDGTWVVKWEGLRKMP
ncbi:MAG: hypothetical protein EOO92_05425 [Pedobacter sp.]|nr:MAG: hypothetical protein EOO92_05425 [Pedobacter sp.]